MGILYELFSLTTNNICCFYSYDEQNIVNVYTVDITKTTSKKMYIC